VFGAGSGFRSIAVPGASPQTVARPAAGDAFHCDLSPLHDLHEVIFLFAVHARTHTRAAGLQGQVLIGTWMSSIFDKPIELAEIRFLTAILYEGGYIDTNHKRNRRHDIVSAGERTRGLYAEDITLTALGLGALQRIIWSNGFGIEEKPARPGWDMAKIKKLIPPWLKALVH